MLLLPPLLLLLFNCLHLLHRHLVLPLCCHLPLRTGHSDPSPVPVVVILILPPYFRDVGQIPSGLGKVGVTVRKTVQGHGNVARISGGQQVATGVNEAKEQLQSSSGEGKQPLEVMRYLRLHSLARYLLAVQVVVSRQEETLAQLPGSFFPGFALRMAAPGFQPLAFQPLRSHRQ